MGWEAQKDHLVSWDFGCHPTSDKRLRFGNRKGDFYKKWLWRKVCSWTFGTMSTKVRVVSKRVRLTFPNFSLERLVRYHQKLGKVLKLQWEPYTMKRTKHCALEPGKRAHKVCAFCRCLALRGFSFTIIWFSTFGNDSWQLIRSLGSEEMTLTFGYHLGYLCDMVRHLWNWLFPVYEESWVRPYIEEKKLVWRSSRMAILDKENVY